ncbi:MAG: BBP7 family outer membrane beta-barrel protein [Hyphomicrobiales bacterium]
MNSFLSALRNKIACYLLPKLKSVLAMTAAAGGLIVAIDGSTLAADLPGTVFVDTPDGITEDDEGRFFARLSALAMHRANNPSPLLVSSSTGPLTNATSLQGSELKNGWSPGGELILGINDVFENSANGNWNLWGRGQLLGLWSDSVTTQITPNALSLGAAIFHYLNPVSTGDFRAEQIRADYQSIFWSLDLNLEKELNNQTTIVGGLRYFNINETLSLDAGTGNTELCNFLGQCTAVPASGALDVVNRASNQIYGLQLGISHDLYNSDSNRFAINLQALGGIALSVLKTSVDGGFGNRNFFPPNVTDVSAEAKAKEFGFFAEGDLSASYYLSDQISLNLGYRALWIQHTAGVVRAIPNLNPLPGTFINNEASRVETDSMLLHGGRLGLKVRF